MTPTEFWQNFKLGQELEIASNFIYDGLKSFHNMDTLGEEREIFPVLYDLSIGLERLFKVAIILAEFEDGLCADAFEKSLKTHDHTKLSKRLEVLHLLNLEEKHKDFLELLATFYQRQRYDRFSLKNLTVSSKDKTSLLKFLHDQIGIDIPDESTFIGADNSDEVKNFIGKLVKDITTGIYQIVQVKAREKNLYTYEITSSNSKAGKVLLTDSPITFDFEESALLEALIFLFKTDESSLVEFMNDIEALELDPALSSEYLIGLLRGQPKEVQGIVDEVEACHEDLDDLGDRLDMIRIIKDHSGSL